MKKIIITLLLSLCTFAIIIGCSESGNSNYNSPSSSDNSGIPSIQSNPNQSSQKSPTKPPSNLGGSTNPTIALPYDQKYTPSDILDQIAWAGVGGGELGQPCGNCLLKFNDNQGQITLSGFGPNQSLRILVYKPIKGKIWENAIFLTEFDVDVDSSGQLTIDVDGNLDKKLIFYALDRYTEKIEWREVNADIVNEPCPGAPPQRVKIGDKAYVCTKNDTVRLRESPAKKYDVILSLVPGAEFDIIFGPACSDNWTWWQVETESGVVGWIAEGGDEVDPYFLCPQ